MPGKCFVCCFYIYIKQYLLLYVRTRLFHTLHTFSSRMLVSALAAPAPS